MFQIWRVASNVCSYAYFLETLALKACRCVLERAESELLSQADSVLFCSALHTCDDVCGCADFAVKRCKNFIPRDSCIQAGDLARHIRVLALISASAA